MKKSFIHQQEEISFVKNTFTQYLKDKLEVVEVQGPILSKVGDGMQDNLSGIENPVSVKVLQIPNETYEVVHSLAKWKRHTLARFGFGEGEGLCSHEGSSSRRRFTRCDSLGLCGPVGLGKGYS